MTPPRTDTQPTARPRARKGDGDLLRDEILDAAEALLVKHGHPNSVSVRAIANRVGVSPPAIYLHFADKEEVFFACCSRRFTELAESIEAAVGQSSNAMDRIEAMCRAYIAFGLERAEQYSVMLLSPIPEGTSPDDIAGMPGSRALMVASAVIAEGVAEGELRADLDPGAAAVALWAACHGTVMVLLLERDTPAFPMPPQDVVVDQAISIMRHGLIA